ncbi:hypothetical protein ACFWN7_10110 [Agromyces sp. NPDC058484]|uniref:hypothetical protein n=1 Tax=Agromyces sp. NPDC058484 TaxID=3346524 RepID=UPI003659E34E
MRDADRELVEALLNLRAEYLDDLGREGEASKVRSTDVEALLRQSKQSGSTRSRARRTNAKSREYVHIKLRDSAVTKEPYGFGKKQKTVRRPSGYSIQDYFRRK